MLELANPGMLCVFPLPWIIHHFLSPIHLHRQHSLRIPFSHRLYPLLETQKKLSPPSLIKWKTGLSYFIWFLLVIAASRPEWIGKPINQPRSGRALMLAIDLSSSMQTQDMVLSGKSVDRLTAVKEVAHKFIEQRKGDRLGLILFGSHAYLQTPLTFDYKTLHYMLDDASIGLAGTETAIGDAIGLAIKQLKKYPHESRVLLLLTDGVSNSGTITPQQAAQIATDEKLKIYTIGVGSDRESLSYGFKSPILNAMTELDEHTLQEIALQTGGMYFRVKNTGDLIKTYQFIEELEPIPFDYISSTLKKPLYPWPLGFALLLSLLLILPPLKRVK
ncbi:MAG: hypothetical protein LEGION0398_MBIBDBAK_00649 [Legionellaceae bacterium]